MVRGHVLCAKSVVCGWSMARLRMLVYRSQQSQHNRLIIISIYDLKQVSYKNADEQEIISVLLNYMAFLLYSYLIHVES